jgi:vitamin B12/bleomycin/antimicrobial peptide transport system ATP-binding/permease protein
MDAEPFTPSIDWGSALPVSLVWIAIAWAATAVVTMVVLVILRFATVWGRQWWRITRGYFIGRESVSVWIWLAVLLLSVIVSVRLDVLFSYQGKDLYNGLQTWFEGAASGNVAVQQSGKHGFYLSLIAFSIMAALWIARIMLDMYLFQRFVLRWRIWLTKHLTDDWLNGRAYYRGRFIDDTIDNPDQRIQQDVDVFTTGVGASANQPAYISTNALLFGAIEAVVSVASFTAILWNLAGPQEYFGVTIPKAMFWILFVFVLVVSIVAFWIGRPLIDYSFLNEKTNAAFRYALVRLRDAAEAVGFYRGERAERVVLNDRFKPIVDNYRRYIRRTLGFSGWNYSVSQVIVPLPWIVQAPRLFAGEIKFGDVGQTATAFGKIQDSLSFFRNAYDNFASFRAAIIRLHGLKEANDKARQLPTITLEDSTRDVVELDGVEIRTPTGLQLIEPLDLRLDPGDGLVVTGRSGTGKTTLLRSLAQLWPYATGTLRRPGEENETMFLSQLPYVPLGNLRAVVSYPLAPGDFPDDEVRRALVKVALPHLVDRLDEAQDWAKVLSPGEQQRVSFARILLTKPKAAFLDEATSALDEGLEMTLYQLIRTELPQTILVSVSHRPEVEQYHEKHLHLLGEGEWRLDPVEKQPEPV